MSQILLAKSKTCLRIEAFYKEAKSNFQQSLRQTLKC